MRDALFEAVQVEAVQVEPVQIEAARSKGAQPAAAAKAPVADAGSTAANKPLDDAAVFATVMQIDGEVYRAVATRQTLALTLAGKHYFLKRHRGVGWAEILKNWLTLRPPVFGADNEIDACQTLAALDIAAPAVVAWGRRGRNPAARESFVLTRAIEGFVSLEDRIADPGFDALEQRRLLLAIAAFSRRLHGAGFVHRDFYLCHLWARISTLTNPRPELMVIDLHRARRFATLPPRYRLRDLAALLYSAFDLNPGPVTLLRFVRLYSGRPLRDEFAERGRFWCAVYRRALRLQRRTDRHRLRRLVAAHPSPLPLASATTAEHLLAAGIKAGGLLKDDPPATIARVAVADAPTCAEARETTGVLKRYNLLGVGHRLRQSLRQRSRARRAWAAGQRLRELGLPVAEPWALVDQRRFGLRQRQYLLQQDLGDASWDAELREHGLSPAREDELIVLMRRLCRHGIEHGDLKASNLMLADGVLTLIDLDATRCRLGGSARDQLRLLRNFAAGAAGAPAAAQDPQLVRRLRQRLPWTL